MAFILISLCASAALAEADGYWTRNADWYYHASEYCGGAEDMVPISLDGAAAFEKHPCPVCVPGGSGEIRGVIESSAGLMALRVPDGWLEARERDGGMENSYGGDKSYEGIDMYRALGDYLSGADLVRFLSDYHAKGRAEAVGWTPSTSFAALRHPMLSRRHIGGAWYYIVYPETDLRGRRDVEWQVNLIVGTYRLAMEDNLLICDNTGSERLQNLNLKFDSQEEEVLFERTDEDMRIRAERVMDAYMLLILRGAAHDPISQNELYTSRLTLRIGEESEIELFENMDAGGYHLYGCIVTEPELDALRGGASLELRTESLWTPHYFGTPYAHTFDGERYIIVDREGRTVREYGGHTIVAREASDRTFRVIDENERYTYLDGWTLEELEKEGEP